MISPTETLAFKTQLMSLRERFDKDIVQLQSEARRAVSEDASTEVVQSPEVDTTRGEEVNLALLAHEQDLAGECNAALARIEDGTFGKCEDCKKPIAKGRLKTLPYTRYCMDCARLREHERG